MVALAVEGIDLFKIAGRSISGWIPRFKADAASYFRQPFSRQLEERLLRLRWNIIPRWPATCVATSAFSRFLHAEREPHRTRARGTILNLRQSVCTIA